MTFNIEEFKTQATAYGFIRPSFFLVAIPAPPKWYSAGTGTKFLTYLCSGTDLPGSQIITSDERAIGYGKTRKIPYDVGHTDINLTFYSDGSGETLSFFESWLRNIVAYGQDNINVKGALRGEVHYPDHYESMIEIYQYNENPGKANVEIVRYTLNQAYPIAVSQQALSWEAGDQISTISVSFAFKDYWITRNKANRMSQATATGALQRNASYNDELQRQGFEAQHQERKFRGEGAETLSLGIIGLDSLSAALGKISKYSNMINDNLNVVNGIASEYGSVINNVANMFGKRPRSIPRIPNFRFP